ncbi:MAG: hypothetical protein ACOH15_11840 [Acetobacterium sp.]
MLSNKESNKLIDAIKKDDFEDRIKKYQEFLKEEWERVKIESGGVSILTELELEWQKKTMKKINIRFVICIGILLIILAIGLFLPWIISSFFPDNDLNIKIAGFNKEALLSFYGSFLVLVGTISLSFLIYYQTVKFNDSQEILIDSQKMEYLPVLELTEFFGTDRKNNLTCNFPLPIKEISNGINVYDRGGSEDPIAKYTYYIHLDSSNVMSNKHTRIYEISLKYCGKILIKECVINSIAFLKKGEEIKKYSLSNQQMINSLTNSNSVLSFEFWFFANSDVVGHEMGEKLIKADGIDLEIKMLLPNGKEIFEILHIKKKYFYQGQYENDEKQTRLELLVAPYVRIVGR